MKRITHSLNLLRGHTYFAVVFLTAVIVLNIILGSVIYFRYQSEYLEEYQRIEHESWLMDQFSEAILFDQMQDTAKIMMTISESQILKAIVADNVDGYIQMAGRNFEQFIKYDQEILELVLFDANKLPLVAVSKWEGSIHQMTHGQISAHGYNNIAKHFKEITDDCIYLTEIHNGLVYDGKAVHETPVIHMYKSIEADNLSKGYVVITLNGSNILKTIKANNGIEGIEKSIVTEEGAWFADGILHESQGEKFDDICHEEWDRFTQKTDKAFYSPRGFYSFKEVTLSSGVASIIGDQCLVDRHFYILSHMSAERMKAIRKAAFKELAFIPITAFLTVVATSLLIAFVMDRSRRYRIMLKHEAQRDPLTGLYNRREGYVLLENLMYVSKRHHRPLSLAYLDIDKLKMVNDAYGHHEGDRLINKVAELINVCKRESDVIARVGGDEFIMILPDCSMEDAKSVFERILGTFEAYNKASDLGYEVSFSYGIVEYNDTIQNLEALVHKADEIMYQHKKRQRS